MSMTREVINVMSVQDGAEVCLRSQSEASKWPWHGYLRFKEGGVPVLGSRKAGIRYLVSETCKERKDTQTDCEYSPHRKLKLRRILITGTHNCNHG